MKPLMDPSCEPQELELPLEFKFAMRKADNVQWTLNMINEMFQQLQDALEMQDYGHYLDEG